MGGKTQNQDYVYIMSFRHKKLRSWKWARTRGYWRVLEVPGALYKKHGSNVDCRFRGVREVDTSYECTTDYGGGRWGDDEARRDMQAAQKRFERREQARKKRSDADAALLVAQPLAVTPAL